MPNLSDTYNAGILYPYLVDEYDNKRNDKTIFEYTHGSHQKVYWLYLKSTNDKETYITGTGLESI